VAALTVIGATTAHAAEIKLIASAAVKGVVLDLIPGFEKSSGHKVTTIWAGTEAITKRIRAGEAVDIVLIAAPNIDKLVSEGRLVAGSRADVAIRHRGRGARRAAETGHFFRRSGQEGRAGGEIGRLLVGAKRLLSGRPVQEDGHRRSDQGQGEANSLRRSGR
jgi:hypothetical protein